MTVTLKSLDPAPEYHSFADLVRGREDEFPVLARATADLVPAANPKIEWTVGDEVWFNWTQIIRYPYNVFGAAEGAAMAEPRPDPLKDEQRDKFLAAIEDTLTHGIPTDQRTGLWLPLRTCGGYRYFLGRELREDDELTLRPLREPVWRVFTHMGYDREDGPVKLDRPIGEWLAEVSLQVVPG